MKEKKFSEYEESLIEEGVKRYFKEARAAAIRSEIEKRITNAKYTSETYQLTQEDLPLFN